MSKLGFWQMKEPVKTDRRQAIKAVAPDTTDYEGEELVHSCYYWWDELSDTYVIDDDEAPSDYIKNTFKNAHPANYGEAIETLDNEGFKLVFYLYHTIYEP